MIQGIKIAGAASYSIVGQQLSNLKEINFIFGTNGSGKTTISRVIADPQQYSTCSLLWAGNSVLECLVYNSDFAARNFSSQMPGIFTLGEAEAGTIISIETTTRLVQSLEGDIQGIKNNLGITDAGTGKQGELRRLRIALEEKCWKIKTIYDLYFQEAFTGHRNSKSSFCDKLLSEWSDNDADLFPLDELKKRAHIVFAKDLNRISPLPTFDESELIALENEAVLAKKVVGKEDIDIAALIRRMGSSDWVRQGLTYIGGVGSQCPFCQQDITEDLARKLSEYFDETYLSDMQSIDRVRNAYETYSVAILERLEAIVHTNNQHLDAITFQADIDRLSAKLQLNLRQLDRKRTEASAQIVLECIAGITSSLAKAITIANEEIRVHNLMVENLAMERATLIKEIWKRLLEDSLIVFTEYVSAKTSLDRAVTGLTAGLAFKSTALTHTKAELAEFEKSVTSVQPTVTEINVILRSFGFTGFRLSTTGEHQNLYEIVRGDGSSAAPTLSEGERSFITFLYFYHLIRGSTTKSGMNAERVIVFDDPISSLDSDVLFIVGSLIKRILEEACSGNSFVKQVFVFTHNIYFHKEVSFDSKRGKECRAHETFWIVRKVNDESLIASYNHNPISTSYELLWEEVRSTGRSKVTIQNTLRRILENYFKILGNLDKDEIVAMFQGRDQQICGSLFSWVNDGSHSFNDDLYISADDGLIARYLDVFRRIFEVSKHKAHYEMMMGAEVLAALAAASIPRAEEEAIE